MKKKSHQKIYIFWYCVVCDEVPSRSFQIVAQIKVIQKVVLPGISKLIDSALDKKERNQPQFSPKEDSRKREIDLILPIIFTITTTDGSCYRVIDLSVPRVEIR